MMPLRVVLFDIDDTLFSTTQFARHARLNAVRAMLAAGLRTPEEDVVRELDEVLREFTSNYDHHYDRLLQRLPKESLEGLNTALIVAAGVAAYHNTKISELAPFDDVYPLFRALRDAGIRIGISTNGWMAKQAEKLVRLRLLPYLDQRAVFISDQVGISKPNPKFFRVVLRELELTPAEIMVVGDNPQLDVAPAKELGMVTVWARRAARRTLEGTDIVPDHIIDDFDEMQTLLRDHHGVKIP